ncbi:hypothetical protein CAP36_08890 [Chitinophagaceae bacterium IBVUCB2]|nr:hypothetical protein CAP36_08890 [Chitinophagaceae bacterium IBVUCB2]
MKKIININLSGRVIPIEDSAYEKLQSYIESLRRYFANEDGRDEIINDIESRIAELMSDKVRKGTTAIADADVEEIISSMGRVEDFEAADKETATAESAQFSQASSSSQQSNTTNTNAGTEPKKERGRLYRDTSDKFIGGVCSGIAAYMNVDPAIVRILFAIITFGGFGLGFLAYLILWVVLPPKDLEGFSGKRLYRNPDDKVIGGVAGGLAAYFGKKATNIRLIFAAPIIFSILMGILNTDNWHNDFIVVPNIVFGSLTGTFFLIYVVLWMVLPEAHSTYEKMEMRGEKVDVNRIRQNVKETTAGFKERAKEWGEEVKESAQNFGERAKEFANTRGKTFAADVNETVTRGGRGLGHVIGVLFKAFFLFIAGTIAFSLFVALIALLFGGIAWWPVNNFLWTSKWQQIYAWGTLIFFLIVPLIGFIIWVFRRITRTKSRNNYLGWTFGALWTVGWVAAILLASSVTKDFREYEHTDTPISITQPTQGKMIVAVSAQELEYTGRFGWMNDGGSTGWDLSSDTLKLSTVEFDVKASADSFYHVTMKKYSFGRSETEALGRAEKIYYTVTSRDSVLDLGNGYIVDKESKFRGQHVEIEIQIPIGKKIRFDESVNDKLNPVNVRVERSRRRNRVVGFDIDSDYRSHRYRSGVDYIMDINGRLKDENGTEVKDAVVPDSNYRYPGNNTAPSNNPENDIQKRIDIEKRKKEESEKIIRDLEEAKKKSQTSIKKTIKKVNTEEKAFASGPLPASSLVQWF